ncbi:MAG TPA: hypothetical protein PKM73_16315 [Verrucomicrobiota bacterium]|nr:hypothetical protein [Verrucomicrobiota bacterium]HNU51426.1 hypothetical protein [Verrucomicrobiota bacterium]
MKRRAEAWRGATLFKEGFGQVMVARFKGQDEVEVGVFLLDLYCLGVKNAFFTRVSLFDYEGSLLASLDEEGGRRSMSPACVRKLVEGAVAYARGLGLEPHPDYRDGARVFGGIDPAECTETFVYGHDGKPLYIRTPHDSEAFANRVMGTLMRRLGPDGFHYILALGPFPDVVGGDEAEDAEDRGGNS